MTSIHWIGANAVNYAERRADIEVRSRCNELTVRRLIFLFTTAILLTLTACASSGPKRLSGDRFDYNEAISRSSKEQMLANIIRFRYLDFPVFMAVSSVITSYSYEGGVGVSGTAGLAEAAGGDSASASANLAYSERPTITYTPLSGQQFTIRMLAPIPVEAIFALGQTGWDIEMLLLTGINRINDVENLSFEIDPKGSDVNKKQQAQRDIEDLRRFRRVVKLLVQLAKEDIIELQRREGESSVPKLVFAQDVPQDFRSAVDELRLLLDLEPNRNEFRVTKRFTRRKSDEIAIHSRSLLAMMSFLAKGVEIPQAHLADGWAEPFMAGQGADASAYLPLRVRSQREQPGNAFAAVQYQGHWFYVDQSDLLSKAVFQMLLALFELQAPAGGAGAPLLTLPAGG